MKPKTLRAALAEGEDAAFETWYYAEPNRPADTLAWEAWKTRAALSLPPSAEAPETPTNSPSKSPTSSNVPEDDIAAAFQGTDFGRTDHRNLLQQSVLKKRVGHECGFTISAIMTRLDLTDRAGNVTKKGKEFIADAYNYLMIKGG